MLSTNDTIPQDQRFSSNIGMKNEASIQKDHHHLVNDDDADDKMQVDQENTKNHQNINILQ